VQLPGADPEVVFDKGESLDAMEEIIPKRKISVWHQRKRYS
jgi:hypothetical protein